MRPLSRATGSGDKPKRWCHQERNAGRNKGSEDDDEDDEGHRDGEHSGFLQVVQEGGLDLLVGADAERADEHVWIGLLRLVDCGDDGVDLLDGVVGIAATPIATGRRRVP